MYLHEIDFQDIFRKWAEGAGPFRCFIRKTNFVSLKHYDSFLLKPVDKRKSRLYKYVCPDLSSMSGRHLAVFDIPAVAGMRLGYLVQKHLRKKPVLTYSSPLHSHGMVGGRNYVNALVGYGEALEKVNPQGYIFILDCRRYLQRVSRRTLMNKFNNQYELTADDLPSIEMLKALDYSEVSFYHRGRVLDDSRAYLQYLRESGMSVKEIDLNPSLFR